MVEEKELTNCEGCGYCCQGETTVSLNESDQKRLTAYLGKPFDEIKKKYLRETKNVIQMQTVDGHCIFYDKGCTVHTAKPWRCAQWPLHPSIISDRSNFEVISGSCPGINKKLEYEEFCRLFTAYLNEKK